MFRLATSKDIEQIVQLLNSAKRRMASDGLEQWADEDGYPNREVVVSDIEKQEMYIIERDQQVAGVCVINDDFYDAYPVTIDKSLARTIHRVAVSEKYLGQGIGKTLYREAIAKSNELGFDIVVVDTYSKNTKMCNLIEASGFTSIGEFQLFEDLPNWIMYVYNK